ncbi:MAG: Kelch repeat-containing protein [Anaerolineae bacterium]
MAEQAQPELSEREIELLTLLVTGATNQQIGLQLHISVNTVKTHLRNIFVKLGVESRTEATLYAIQHNLVQMPAGAVPEAAAAEAPAPVDLAIPAPAVVHQVPVWLALGSLGVILAVILGVFLWPSTAAQNGTAANPFVDDTASQNPLLPIGASGRWHRQAALSEPRARFAQVTVANRIYVLGGLTSEGWSSAVEVYDPDSDTWQRLADKPTAVANVGAVVLDGLIYIPGGQDSSGQAVTVHEVYDPAADTWRTAAPLPHPLCAYAIAVDKHGYYLLGGWDGSNYLASVYYYDAASDSWSERGSLTSPRGFAAAVLADSQIYLVGGYNGKRVLNLVETADPSASGKLSWHRLAPLAIPRAGLGLAALNGSLYAVGGGWQRPATNSERYDIAAGSWTHFDTPLDGQWRCLGISAVDTDKGTFLAAVGGWSEGYLATVWFYQTTYRVFVP